MTSIPIEASGSAVAGDTAGPFRAPPPTPFPRRVLPLPTTPRARAAAGHGARRSKAGVLGAALLGFLVGAVFWHVIGFWDFVRDVAFKGASAESRVVAQLGVACSAAVLDRNTQRVYHAPCPSDAPELVEAMGEGKSDFAGVQRMAARKRWSVTVLAEPEPADDAEVD